MNLGSEDDVFFWLGDFNLYYTTEPKIAYCLLSYFFSAGRDPLRQKPAGAKLKFLRIHLL